MIAASRPIGPHFQYFFDPKGRLDYKIDANDQRTDYEYTSGDWLEKIIYNTDPKRIVTFTHDENGNIETWSDDSIYPGGPIYTYTYDKLNRVDRLTNHLVNKTLDYDFDRFGNREKLALKEGETEVFANTYIHNKREQLTRLYENHTEFIRFVYYATGRVKTRYFPGELVRGEYDYFDDGNFKTIAYKKSDDTVLSSYAYNYDNVGHNDDMTDLKGLHDFSYDKIYQLTSATHPGLPAETFTYDWLGNRKTSAEYPEWSYDDNNRLKAYNGVSFEHDDNGNTVKKTVNESFTNYHYDYANRLRQVDLPDTRIAKYTYDYLGRRIKKDIDGVITWYIYDDFTLLSELDSFGTLITRYTFAPNSFAPLSLRTGGLTFYYQNDHTESPREMTTIDGEIAWSAKYTSFGDASVEPSSTIINNFRFAGQYFDEETGLHYNYFRYYDPKIGRYLTPDPIGLAVKINHYSYVSNNPVNAIDPFGLRDKYVGFGGPDGWRRFSAALSATNKSRGSRSSGGTVGIGVGGTGGAGAAGSVSGMLVVDTKGNIGFVESGGGGGMGGVGGSGGIIIQVTTAKDIYQLKGLSTQTGGSIGEGLVVGVEYIIGDGYTGVNFTFGLGGGWTPVELHSVAEYAKVQGRSIEDILNFIKQLISDRQKTCP
jgi:RHS repeat-associated protein